MESFDENISDNYGPEEFRNTAPMEYVSPYASYFISEEADTEPLCAEEVWGNLGCVSPVDAKGIENMDFNLECSGESTHPLDMGDISSFSLNFQPDLDLLGQDITRDTLMSRIDTGFKDINKLTSIPKPTPSTSLFIKSSYLALEDKCMDTVNPNNVEGMLPSIKFEPVQMDCTTTYITSPIPDEEGEEADDNAPDRSLHNLQDMPVSPGSRRQLTPKAKLHYSLKKEEKKRRRQGRPERQEPVAIRVVHSRRASSSMRDLNNKPSKDYRARRKNKIQVAEVFNSGPEEQGSPTELEQLTEKNLMLRQKLAEMEKEMAYYRRMSDSLLTKMSQTQELVSMGKKEAGRNIISWVFVVVAVLAGMSLMTGSKGANWRNKIFLDPEADGNGSTSTEEIADKDIRNRMNEYKNEMIHTIWMYRTPLNEIWQWRWMPGPFYHEFVVLQTDDYWWSIEKNTKVIQFQRAKSKEAVVKKINQKLRCTTDYWAEPEVVKRGRAKVNIMDLVNTIYEKDLLYKTYHVGFRNCQGFAEEIYQRALDEN